MFDRSQVPEGESVDHFIYGVVRYLELMIERDHSTLCKHSFLSRNLLYILLYDAIEVAASSLAVIDSFSFAHV